MFYIKKKEMTKHQMFKGAGIDLKFNYKIWGF